MENIFPFGRPVKGEHLVGREDVIRDILSLVENNQSVMMVGPRRYGKTSVLLEVQRRIDKVDWYVGRVDIFDIPSKEKLAEKIVRTTLRNKSISMDGVLDAAKRGIKALREKIELKKVTSDGMEIILSFSDKNLDKDALLDESLDFPENFADKQGKKMCFIYDEMGDLLKMNGDLIKKMRAKFQMQEKTVYLFSGSQESLMNEMFIDKKGAFYGFCRVIELDTVPISPFKDYIDETFNGVGIDIPSEEIDEILEKTNGHPYYTQYLCQVLYLDVKDGKTVKHGDVDRAFEQVLEQQRTYLDDIWGSIKSDSILQLKICLFLSSSEHGSVYSYFDDAKQNIYAALQSLSRKGFVRKTEEGYKLVDPLLKEYLNRKSDSL